MQHIQEEPTLQAPPERRKSVFTEVGLVDETTVRRERSPAPILISSSSGPSRLRPPRIVRFRSKNDVHVHESDAGGKDEGEWDSASDSGDPDVETVASMKLRATRPMISSSKSLRLALLALLLALMVPVLHTSPLYIVGAKAGVIPRETIDPSVVKRDNTDTNICKRWSHQSAIVNGTLYIYGGRATTDASQTSNTWTNDFLTLDLTKSWQISNPSLTGLAKPSGPPAVANGYLWNSYSSLFLYGGEFSDTPVETPSAQSTWEYQISSQKWVEHTSPKTSSGNNSASGNQDVQRSAEGSGFSVTTLGRGWYFGGHQDWLTTPGWSNQINRVYLKSLLEFTFPGWTNNGVDDLKGGKTAGSDGVYRNVTEGGLQDTAGFTERADGLLVYVPGFGAQGILLGLTGGTNATFTQMNVVDVYDIANSTWYKQTTSGKMPQYRVNPCAVVGAAADGSSYNVYMFGGQNLLPYGDQTQYDDMWILSVPSFTWISVDQSKQSVPYARAGHSCNVWDGQIIVVGGYVGQNLSCDSPGIYVFNMSSLTWSDQFTALTGSNALKAYDGGEGSGNPLAQQANQRGSDAKSGLEGSYGYAVPAVVQSVIGGNATGGATLTAPVQTPTSGPLATGKPYTYTVTGPSGAIITETSSAASGSSDQKTRVGAIAAGVIAGVLLVVAAYFAFCAWIYRKQVLIWKNHAAMVAARHSSEKNRDPFGPQGALITSSSGKNSSERRDRDALFPPTDTGSASGARTSDERRTGTGAGSVAGGSAAGAAGGLLEGERRRSSVSSTDDLLEGQEPSFWGVRGVLLNPRRSLRVINRD